jgi:carbamoyl-phosphate synthase large subunit
VQQLGAAVQGIESQLTDTVRVKSLQDHARELNFYAPTNGAVPIGDAVPIQDTAATDDPT